MVMRKIVCLTPAFDDAIRSAMIVRMRKMVCLAPAFEDDLKRDDSTDAQERLEDSPLLGYFRKGRNLGMRFSHRARSIRCLVRSAKSIGARVRVVLIVTLIAFTGLLSPSHSDITTNADPTSLLSDGSANADPTSLLSDGSD